MIPQIKRFYEEYPFPNYNFLSLKTKEDLYHIKNYIFNLINKEEIKGKEILEIGCGTGVLSAKLALYNTRITGTDISKTSLQHARNLFKKFNLKGTFIKDDIINTKLNTKFDIVISLGVLHHTEDPKKAFENVCKLTKKNGIIIIALYSKYYNIVNKIKYFIMDGKLNINSKVHFFDKYKNPKRSSHSIDEILDWFNKNNIEFINVFPPIDLNSYFKLIKKFNLKLFKIAHIHHDDSNFDFSSIKLISGKGNKFGHFLIELAWLFCMYDGTVMMIGRKN